MIKSSLSSLLTFYEHPKEVGQMEIMQQYYENDARWRVYLHWDLWTNSKGHKGREKTAESSYRLTIKNTVVFTRAVGCNIKQLRLFNYGYLILWA